MKLSKYWTSVTPFSFTLASILFIALPFIGFWVGVNYQQSLNLNQTTNQVIKPIKYTSNWKTYIDKMNRFSFKYPTGFAIKEDIGGSNTVFYTDFKDSDEEFRFEVGPSDYVGLFEHFKTNQNENINNISWIIDSNTEYCDAGNCGTSTASLYVKHNNYYVGISVFKEVKSKDTLKNILSTFKFTN